MSEFTEQEMAVLKEMAEKKTRSAWRDYPFLFGSILGTLGFVVALVTAIVSIRASWQKDIHDQRADLVASIRTIHELRLKAVELQDQYKDKPEQLARATGLINNQINTATLTAGDTALQLGRNVTTSAVIPLAQGLYFYGEYVKAERLAELGLQAARGPEGREFGSTRIGFHENTQWCEGGRRPALSFGYQGRSTVRSDPVAGQSGLFESLLAIPMG
jgi:hypothetical protein